jgi:hypothetical protein
MESRHLPQTCKWCEQTLLQPMPLWLDAWNYEWTCVSCGEPRLLEASEECEKCPRWEERPASAPADLGTAR